MTLAAWILAIIAAVELFFAVALVLAIKTVWAVDHENIKRLDRRVSALEAGRELRS